MDNLMGLVVKSKAGRDKGNNFVVIRTEGEFAYIANGDLRKVSSPKKKKLKHLQMTGYEIKPIKEKLLSNVPVSDKELRKALAEYLK